MSDLKNQTTLTALRDGDQGEMKRIFQEHYRTVYLRIYRFVKQKETAEDLTQEVFLKLWRKKNQLEITDSLGGYLATMAYHEAMGFLRKNHATITDIDEQSAMKVGSDGNQEINRMDLQQQINTAVNQLPPRCKSVFVLSRFEGKSYKEIAEIMNISTKTVEHQLSKALRTLRLHLKDYIQMCLLILAFF